jgi:hypothetical protein
LNAVRQAVERVKWQGRETNYLLLRRGPYLIGAGLDESIDWTGRTLRGRFVNLFDPELLFRREVTLSPGSRWFLLDLDRMKLRQPGLLASACKTLPLAASKTEYRCVVEGVAETTANVLFHAPRKPRSILLGGQEVSEWRWDKEERLLWVRFGNTSGPRELSVNF